jgi:hypothetical protein
MSPHLLHVTTQQRIAALHCAARRDRLSIAPVALVTLAALAPPRRPRWAAHVGLIHGIEPPEPQTVLERTSS